MALRNFWIEAQIDGRKTALTGGPVSKEGGFVLDIRQRDKGSSFLAYRVVGYVGHYGRLIVEVTDRDGRPVSSSVTTR